MGIEQALLGEWLLTYVFFVYGMMCYAMRHNKAKLPGFPVRAQDEDYVLMCYWMHEQGIIKKNGLRFLGIKQQTIDEFFDAELCKYNQEHKNKKEINFNSLKCIEISIINRHKPN